MSEKTKVVPCSGIGKVYGLMAREAVLTAVHELCPGKAETVCLGYIVTGDREAKEKIEGFDCVTVDGCPKMCAAKNVKIAGGVIKEEIKVMDTVKEIKSKNYGSATKLEADGEKVVAAIAAKIAGNIA